MSNPNPRDIIRKPLITERSMHDMADNKYTFAVALDANKVQIRQAIEQIFKVKVESVHTMRMHGKTRRMGRFTGQLPDWKKAIVKLKAGEKIAFFEGMGS